MTPPAGARLGALWHRLRSGGPRRHVAHYEPVLGTSLELQLVAESDEAAARGERAALDEIDRLEAVFSAYRPESELSRWQATHGVDLPVSPELAGLLEQSELWRARTGGAFDPGVEAATRLWREHASRDEPPADAALAELAERIAAPLWSVDRERSTARRLTRLPVTLNAIAKGFIIDAACARAAATEGVGQALVNIGGDLRHAGPRPLVVDIADPFADAENAPPLESIRILGQGLATSGNYRRGFRIRGEWHSHLIDPRTARPVERVVSASVVAPTAAVADVLATAFSVLDPAESLALADSLPDIACLLVTREGGRAASSAWGRLAVAESTVTGKEMAR
jgi:thiamine biosynthesis lipoprotein